ncbi:MAG: hypothetical protein R2941_04395 [Desulfobacterales bacterium]
MVISDAVIVYQAQATYYGDLLTVEMSRQQTWSWNTAVIFYRLSSKLTSEMRAKTGVVFFDYRIQKGGKLFGRFQKGIFPRKQGEESGPKVKRLIDSQSTVKEGEQMKNY